MIIRKVSLKNIKSYREAEIELPEGITGIAGLNGAGKSTVLESIGYALFDCLPYTQGEFVRKGEKTGEVAVEILGADGIGYRIVRKCGASQAYYIENEDGARVCEGKDDVGHLLCEILGYRVHELGQLRALFENAIGVLQGTFVSEFLESAARRKAIFDPLLRIDEYIIAYKNLVALKNTVKERIDRMENEKKFLEGRASQLESLKGERTTLIAEKDRLSGQLEEKRRALDQAREKKERMDALEKEVLEIEARCRVAFAEISGARRDEASVVARLESAEAAEKKLKESESGYRAYVASQEEKEALEKMRAERDAMLASINAINTRIVELKAKVSAADRTLQEVEQAEREIPGLRQKAREQERLEGEKEQIVAFIRAKEIELQQVSDRMGRARDSKGNMCPILIDVECSSVKDFSGYFSEQVKRIEAAKAQLQAQALAIAEQLGDLRNPKVGLAVQAEILKKRDRAAAEKQGMGAELEAGNAELLALMSRLKKYETLERRIREVNGDIARLMPAYEEYQQNMKVAGQRAELQQALEKVGAALRGHEESLRHVSRRLEEMRSAYSKDEHAAVKTSYESLSGEVASCAAQTAAITRQLAEIEEKIRKIDEDLAQIEEIRRKQTIESEYLGFVELSRGIIKVAGPEIVKVYIDLISREATDTYGEIAGDRRIAIRWTPDYDIVMSEDGRERAFRQLSGGEQMSAALAVRLAILKILTSSDVVFLDEPTQNMDEGRRLNLAQEIMRITGFRQMIVISHDDTFNANLENVIEIEKVNGESCVRGRTFAGP